MFNKRKSSPEGLAGLEAPPLPDATRAALATAPVPAPEHASALRSTGDNRAKPAPIAVLPSADKPSIVSEGFTITGDLRSSGVLHVEGRVSGTLVAHSINISVTGEIQGEITCTSLNIKGHMKGKAVCDELIVASTAQVQGNISYRFLSIGSGATIQGDLNHIAN